LSQETAELRTKNNQVFEGVLLSGYKSNKKARLPC